MTTMEVNSRPVVRDRHFDAFYTDRYLPMVALAAGMVDHRCEAEEIVQDALHRLWQRWESVDEPARYLRTMVINGCHDELRRRRIRRDANRSLRHRAPVEQDYLADVLAGVDPRRREALVLRFYGGHTMSEVAAAMEIPTGTAKSLIHRGLADMRGALERSA
ncbi:MAG: sigma-70 family RNA polymerase sigma factor [Acidimicrobiales bacterium]